MANVEGWTLIWALPDVGISSVQMVVSNESDPEEAARAARRDHDWLESYALVAAVRGASEIKVRDDARAEELGLQ